MAVVDALVERRARQGVRVLSRYANVVAAYLFGSHVEGTSDEYSDVDVAVFIEQAQDWDLERQADANGIVHKEVGSDIELHYFSARALPNPEPASFASWVIRHGVPIDFRPEPRQARSPDVTTPGSSTPR